MQTTKGKRTTEQLHQLLLNAYEGLTLEDLQELAQILKDYARIYQDRAEVLRLVRQPINPSDNE